ncbi:MAG: GAF domain-containing protein [Desulfosarcina sp.]|nr:GAF domain-containing protein [Desulfobacterales bacterium]
MSEIIKKELEECRKQVAFLEKGHQDILEMIDRMERLIQFQDKVDITFNIKQIWTFFLKDIKNLIDIDVCALFLVDEETHDFVLEEAAPEDRRAACRKEVDSQIECGMFAWVIQRRKPAIISPQVFKEVKTVIMLPLSTIKRTLGVVLIVTDINEKSITQENIKLLTLLSRQCSLVMENTVLYENLKKEQQSRMKAQAQIFQAEKLASIGRLTSGASHEILNPLNIITGHIQLIKMDTSLSRRAINYLDIMRKQSNRIAEIIKSLSIFFHNFKSEAGYFNINDLLESSVLLAGCDFNFDHINIINNFTKNLPWVMGNQEDIAQVVLNLLSNARDAMPDGGTIYLSTRLSSENGNPESESDLIEVKIEDNGCGIREEDISRIFDPFFTTKEPVYGTGLGLSISYGIVNYHGGTIKVKSALSKGSIFSILLPASGKKI